MRKIALTLTNVLFRPFKSAAVSFFTFVIGAVLACLGGEASSATDSSAARVRLLDGLAVVDAVSFFCGL